MEDAEVVKLLQHYRHDLMNHLQIVQGYISMNKSDKAEQKLKETIVHYNEERKLMHLNIPVFTLWVLQMNIRFDHIKFEYYISTEKKLSHLDNDLKSQCTNILSAVNKTYGTNRLYEISMEIKDVPNSPIVEISFLIKGENRQGMELSSLTHDHVRVRQTPSGMLCSFQIDLNT